MPSRREFLCAAVHVRGDYDVYIGRAGHGFDGYFGNPIRTGTACPECKTVHVTPGATLPCYESYFARRLRTDPAFLQRVEGLHGLRLGCFCKPGPCHGDVIAAYLNRA